MPSRADRHDPWSFINLTLLDRRNVERGAENADVDIDVFDRTVIRPPQTVQLEFILTRKFEETAAGWLSYG